MGLAKAIGFQNDFQECVERNILNDAERMVIMSHVSLDREEKRHFLKNFAFPSMATMDSSKCFKHHTFNDC